MAKFTWIVCTNCTPGQEVAFNDWYDNVHLHDVLRIPGVVSAHRAELSPNQMILDNDGPRQTGIDEIGAMYRFVSVYRIDADDVRTVLHEIERRANTEEMPLTEHMTEAHTIMFEDLPALTR